MAKSREKPKKKICEFWKEGMICTLRSGQLCEKHYAQTTFKACPIRNVYGGQDGTK